MKDRPSRLGILSPALGDLHGLVTLHLDFHDGNHIGGKLPEEIGNLMHLEELILNGHGRIHGKRSGSFNCIQPVLCRDHSTVLQQIEETAPAAS